MFARVHDCLDGVLNTQVVADTIFYNRLVRGSGNLVHHHPCHTTCTYQSTIQMMALIPGPPKFRSIIVLLRIPTCVSCQSSWAPVNAVSMHGVFTTKKIHQRWTRIATLTPSVLVNRKPPLPTAGSHASP